MKKNILLSEALREETREVQFSSFLALFAVGLVACSVIYWVGGYSQDLGVMDALVNALKTILIWLFAGSIIVFSGGHAIERGKRARYYYHALAKCPPTARGRRI